MKTIVMALTLVALASPFAHAADQKAQHVGSVVAAASNGSVSSQQTDPDPNPYVVHG